MRLTALLVAGAISAFALGTGTTAAHAAPVSENNTSSSAQMVTIQPGDSLSKIATNEGSTIERLYFANTQIENPDMIYPNDQLRVPAANEELAARPMPTAVVTPVVAPAPVVSTSAVSTPAAVAPAPQYIAPAAPIVASGGVWDQLAQCESGGNWAINTGNGFYGGLQFTLSSWQATGGSGLPSYASREEQIMRAERLLAMQGWGAWPACTAKLGLR